MSKSRFKIWLTALRLKTIPASVIPIAIASSYAYKLGEFDQVKFTLILFCAIMIQIITNFFNEIYDFKKGADTNERLGPDRGVSRGDIQLSTMWTVTIISLIITLAAGLYLVYLTDLNILFIGLVSLVLTWAYTGGPYPLAYKGLGDIFVFVFFGIIATCGSYYAYTQSINDVIIFSSFIPGFLSMNILSANNIRDINTDIKVGKITMAVRMGDRLSRYVYILILLLAFVTQFYIFLMLNNTFLLLPFITIVLAIPLIKEVMYAHGKEMNKVLALSGVMLMLFGTLQTIAFIL